jgi:CheY-like chemotaxis protein
MAGTDHNFKSRSLRIVVVDQSAALRQILVDILRELGFSSVECFGSISDAHNYLEIEKVDWIILPLYANEPVNALQTLKLNTCFSELIGTKVSLMLDDSDQWVLEKAFELGMFSYHKRCTNRDELQSELQSLLTNLEKNSWDTTKTSLSYLRHYLLSTKQYSDLLFLEKRVMDLYPGDGDSLISLAEAQRLSGEPHRARATLVQAKLLCPEKIETIDLELTKLEGSHSINSIAETDAASLQNILGLKAVVIIDPDGAVRSTICAMMRDLGCTSIFDFEDGECAFSWMKQNGEPDLIIMEWRIPKVSGPIFLQRIKSLGFVRTPIIIASSLIKKSDVPLIRELGVANLALKPIERENLLKTVIWTIQQDRAPSDLYTMENKIRNLLSRKEIRPAEDLIKKYLSHPRTDQGGKAIFRAELAYAKEQYEEACKLAVDALRQSGESLFGLNILGKCLMTMRDYESALKCFQKAQSISPMNLERLLSIAEAQAELGEHEDATASINKAKDIDPDSPTVLEGEARVAISTGSVAEAQASFASLESHVNLIRYLNNKAVAHAKCGFAKEGLEIYQKTLAAIPNAEYDLTAVVIYNTALAKIRVSDLQGAIEDLNKIPASHGTRISPKVESLKARLQAALEANLEFKLSDTPPPATMAAVRSGPAFTDSNMSQASVINTLLTLNPGDQCCYLLYKSTRQESPEIIKIMQTPIRFRPRKALEREESFTGAKGIKVAS